MKRLLIFAVLLFSYIGVYADELSEAVNRFGETLNTIITKQTNGYVTEEVANEYYYSTFIRVPDYYDNSLIIATINPIIEDAKFLTVKPWTAVKDGIISECQLGDAAKINFRFDFIRHHLMLMLQAIRE